MPTHAPPTTDVPVVIVGAGPVGLTTAILLAQYGVRTLVLERYPKPYPLPRAVHVDDEVLRILQQVGIADAFAQVSRPAAGLRLVGPDHRVIAEFRRDQAHGRHGHPPSTLFDQPDLDHLLRTELARYPQAELRTGVEVTALDELSGPPTRLRVHHQPYPRPGTAAPEPGGSVIASAVIGCDGAQSTVRGFVGARLDDLGFEERWLVLDGRCAGPLNVWDGVDQVCDPHRPATAMRIGADRYRWEFRLNPAEAVTEMLAPQRLRKLLQPWTGDRPDTGVQVVRAIEYTFAARLADRWRRGRVFLAGDAAHLTPPFIGQGLGSGLRDAHNLAWKLACALSSSGPDDERLLDSYQSERRPHARALIRLAVLTGWAMTGGQGRAATVRRVLLAGFCRIPGATTTVLDRPGPPLTASAVVHRWHRLGRDPAGRLVPQPWVHTATGEQRLDDVLGTGFAVLADGPVHADLLTWAGRLGVPVIRLDPAGVLAGRPPAVRALAAGVIRSPELRAWMSRYRVGAVLVRPDRVVLAAAPRSLRRRPVGAALATVGRTTIRSHWVALLGIRRPLG